ncbi:MAG: CoA pyrophosphatase [Thermoplasmata archaeon]
MPADRGSVAGGAPANLAELLGRFPATVPPVAAAGAAVTIVLREGASEVETLLIERTERPTDPASGQVALPGGRVETADGSLVATALRELQEEVGITRADLVGPPRYVGTENAVRFGIRVAIFADSLGPAGHPPTALSVEEVAHVFWMPRSALADTRRVHRETSLGRTEVPATVFEGHVLWGFTRRVVRQFFGFPVEDEWGGPAFSPDPSRNRSGDADASRRQG